MAHERQKDWNPAALEAIRHPKATWAERFAENLMPAILEATRASATIGELTQVLRDVFGEFREPVTL